MGINTKRAIMNEIEKKEEFEKLKKQNSAYIVFRYLNTKKDIGNELTKVEQDFVNEYLK
jgi:metal-responsive CopG/Arc/MetJ family transcriptional regulator